MRRITALLALTAAFGLMLAPSVHGADAGFTYDKGYLRTLYQALLNRPDKKDAYVEKRIAEERGRVRKIAESHIRSLVLPEDRAPEDAATLKTTVERQRGVITAPEEGMRERRVDLDLLAEEERKYYLSPPTGTGAVEAYRLTTTHADLLAKRAVIEERIAAFDAGLTLQNDRLGKLSAEQRKAEFAALFTGLRYVAVVLGVVLADRLLRRLLVRRVEGKGRRYLVAKFVTAFLYATAIFALIRMLLADYPGAAAGIAIVGAGLAVALQDVVKDVVGGILILQRRLYRLGNRVTIGPHTGDIVDIGLLRTTMLEVSTDGTFNAHERTGKTLHLPNSLVLREPVLNYHTTSDYMNVEMRLTVTLQSDWRKAEEMLRSILQNEAALFVEPARLQETARTALFYGASGPGEPRVGADIVESGIEFILSFTVPIGRRRSVVTTLTKEILAAFDAEPKVEIAYRTVTVLSDRGPTRALPRTP